MADLTPRKLGKEAPPESASLRRTLDYRQRVFLLASNHVRRVGQQIHQGAEHPVSAARTLDVARIVSTNIRRRDEALRLLPISAIQSFHGITDPPTEPSNLAVPTCPTCSAPIQPGLAGTMVRIRPRRSQQSDASLPNGAATCTQRRRHSRRIAQAWQQIHQDSGQLKASGSRGNGNRLQVCTNRVVVCCGACGVRSQVLTGLARPKRKLSSQRHEPSQKPRHSASCGKKQANDRRLATVSRKEAALDQQHDDFLPLDKPTRESNVEPASKGDKAGSDNKKRKKKKTQSQSQLMDFLSSLNNH
jgi:hypothetical protein